MFLVEAVSARWNWYLTREPVGKVVWCELDAKRPSTPKPADLLSVHYYRGGHHRLPRIVEFYAQDPAGA